MPNSRRPQGRATGSRSAAADGTVAVSGTGLTARQRSTFAACFLGWSLDAFDFFLLTLCLRAVAGTFQVDLKQAAASISWTLAMRPLGALLFGALAERFGRRPTLMLNVVSFSIFELLSAFAPTFGTFLVCRALFGVAMGGEWGVGAALAMETLPAERRGFFSGLLQEGYVVGNLLAAALFAILYPHLHGTGVFTPWRVLFMIGTLPALLALYLRFQTEESPVWLERQAARRRGERATGDSGAPGRGVLGALRRFLPRFAFLVLLMTAFNSFSHGTQDLYPTFLGRDRGLDARAIGWLVVAGNLGALAGGVTFGALSERWGRRRAIVTAALLAVPAIPLWMGPRTWGLLAVGGFAMQFMVQGAWGVVPAHLNELSPGPVRALFPGLAYQVGSLLSSWNGVFQAGLAASLFGGALRPVMAGTALLVALMVAALAAAGGEAKGAAFVGAG